MNVDRVPSKQFAQDITTMPSPARFLINLIEFPLLHLGSQNVFHHRVEHGMAVVP
jgi:hypothetical protein